MVRASFDRAVGHEIATWRDSLRPSGPEYRCRRTPHSILVRCTDAARVSSFEMPAHIFLALDRWYGSVLANRDQCALS